MGKQKAVSRQTKKDKKRSLSVDDEHIWTNFFERLGIATGTGKYITPDNALQVSAVFACIRVLAETVASLPLIVYQKTDAGKKEATDHYLYPLLHDSPNIYQTSYEMREMLMGHTCLRGNSYSYKEINKRGEVVALYPLNSANMTVKKDKERIIYEYVLEDGTMENYPSDFIWHIKGISSDGIIGLSPITLARESISLALSAEEHGAKYFANDATPSGILTFPGKLAEDAEKKLKTSWQEAHGRGNKFKTALLQGGLEWKNVGMSNEDSQYLETRQFQIEDIARIFRVPSVLINHADKTSTYASAEQFFLSFVVHTVRPWTVRIEQSINKNLFTERDKQDGFFAEFKLDGLLRGDISSRYTAYSVGRNWGWLSVNDIRKLENLNPIPDGDIYLQPLNMVEAGKPQAIEKEPKKEPVASGNNGGNNGNSDSE